MHRRGATADVRCASRDTPMTLAVHSAARCGAVDYAPDRLRRKSAAIRRTVKAHSVLLHAGGVGVQVLQMRNMHGLTDLAVARLGRAAAPSFPLPLPVEVLPGPRRIACVCGTLDTPLLVTAVTRVHPCFAAQQASGSLRCSPSTSLATRTTRRTCAVGRRVLSPCACAERAHPDPFPKR